jgi:hypothetical protein
MRKIASPRRILVHHVLPLYSPAHPLETMYGHVCHHFGTLEPFATASTELTQMLQRGGENHDLLQQ